MNNFELKNKLSILQDQYDRLSKMPIACFDEAKKLFKTDLDPYFWGNSHYIYNRRQDLLDDIHQLKIKLLDIKYENKFNWSFC